MVDDLFIDMLDLRAREHAFGGWNDSDIIGDEERLRASCHHHIRLIYISDSSVDEDDLCLEGREFHEC